MGIEIKNEFDNDFIYKIELNEEKKLKISQKRPKDIIIKQNKRDNNKDKKNIKKENIHIINYNKNLDEYDNNLFHHVSEVKGKR